MREKRGVTKRRQLSALNNPAACGKRRGRIKWCTKGIMRPAAVKTFELKKMRHRSTWGNNDNGERSVRKIGRKSLKEV